MANQMGVSVRKETTEKNFRRTFTMTMKRNQKNGIKKNKKNSNPAVGVSNMREVNRVSKAVKAVAFVNDNEKNACLRKLSRACAGTKSQCRGAAKAE